jgi:hypothetical protein
LAEALQPDAIAAYGRRATGEKYLIVPQKGVARHQQAAEQPSLN